MITGVLVDLAGVLYEGEQALPGAPDAVARLRHAVV
jgi:ribonucleotide monophosphatase NagD (HAD superfamily)